MKKELQLFIFLVTSAVSAELVLQSVNLLSPGILYESTKGLSCDTSTCYSDRYVESVGWDNFKWDPDNDGIRNTKIPYDKVCGASFVWSNDVDADSSFSGQLSKQLGCKVDNYGVGGYSFSQAKKKYELYAPSVDILIFNLNRQEVIQSLSGSSYTSSGSKVINPRPYYVKSGSTFNLMEPPEKKGIAYLRNYLAKDYYLGWVSPKFPLVWSLPNYNLERYKRSWSWKNIAFLDIPIFEQLFNHIVQDEVATINGHSLIIINTYPEYLTEENVLKLESHTSKLVTKANVCFALPGRNLLSAVNEGVGIKGKSGHFNETAEKIIADNLGQSIELCRRQLEIHTKS
jgi:hypothetical protein